MKKFVILLLFVGLSLKAFTQSYSAYQTAFYNGKELFKLDKFELAMEAFKPAMYVDDSNPYGPYANFYYALSAYKAGLESLARDHFFKTINQYPNWEDVDECRYWVSVIYFEQGRYFEGLNIISEINDESLSSNIENLELFYLSQINDIDSLKDLKSRFPENIIISEVIFDKILENPLEDRDLETLKEVSDIPELEEKASWMLGPDQTIRKDKYRIGILFPFRLENMQAAGTLLRASLVNELYNGMKLSMENLEGLDSEIELYAFDTKGDSVHTASLLETGELDQMDVIVGPLTAQTSRLVNNYAYLNQINIINPISSNPNINANNPYSFLFKPSATTLGEAGVSYAVDFLENKNTVIYMGEREQDSLMAFSFINNIPDSTLELIRVQRLTKSNTHKIYEWLTEEQEVLDSLGGVVLDEDTDLPLKELVIKPDSIGAIFVSSFDDQIASEVISAVLQRGDSITVIGHGRWLELKFADFGNFERAGVKMISSGLYDYHDLAFRAFVKQYLEAYRKLPSSYASTGYEIIQFLSYCLDRHGTYFQLGLKDEVVERRGFYPGFDYRVGNDNHFISVLSFDNLSIVVEDTPFNK